MSESGNDEGEEPAEKASLDEDDGEAADESKGEEAQGEEAKGEEAKDEDEAKEQAKAQLWHELPKPLRSVGLRLASLLCGSEGDA